MSAALARAAALAKATVLELQSESSVRVAEGEAVAKAKADAAAASALARSKDVAAVAAEATMQSTVAEFQALVETQRFQSADAKETAALAAASLSSLISQRQAAAEASEVRIRALERALAEAQAENARLSDSADANSLTALELQRRLQTVHQTLLSTENILSSREALLATIKREFILSIQRADAAIADAAAVRTAFEARGRVMLEQANAACRRALCAEAAVTAKCTALEADAAAHAAENERLRLSLAQQRAAAKEAATERVELLAALQQSGEVCAALQKQAQ